MKLKKNIIKIINYFFYKFASEEKVLMSIRTKFRVNPKYSSKHLISYRIAETEKEVIQALNLLQKTYKEIDVVDDSKQTIRVNKYNILPSSTIFIAVRQGEVIGTVTQVLDTVIGLPIDGHSDISRLRETGEKICEISGLAVKKEWRNSNVFIPLVTFAKEYIKNKVGAKYTVIVVNKKASLFYKAVFLFEALEGVGRKYKNLNDYSAMSFYVDNLEVYDEYKVIYNNQVDDRNLYKMIVDPVWKDQIVVKHELPLVCMEPLYKFDIVSIIAKKLEDASLYDELIIKNMFYFESSSSDNRIMFAKERLSPRINVKMKLNILNECFELFDISIHGICFITENKFQQNEPINFSIRIDHQKTITLSGRVVWMEKNRIGLNISSGEVKEWEVYLLSLYEMLNFSNLKGNNNTSLVA
jgi:hypothetical protein